MPLMVWDAKQHSVHVQKFDSDHKHLFALVNQLTDAMQARRGKNVLGIILGQLVRYTQQHFASEEVEMARTAFPEYKLHVSEHQQLTAKVEGFAREYEAGNALVSIELLHFLRDWLEQHILDTDKKYGPHLNTKGVF
jgi:hemerythrin